MKNVVLIDYDCLSDTRLPILEKLVSGSASKIVSHPKKLKAYRERIRDDFPEFGISHAIFREAWLKRKADILPMAFTTPFTFLLTEIVDGAYRDMLEEPHRYTDGFEVHINLWPYHDGLTHKVREALLASIIFRIEKPVNIRFVNISPKKLTPDLIKTSSYNVIYKYDFDQWLTTHFGADSSDEEVQNRRIPEVVFYIPFLLAKDLDNFKETMEYKSPTGETADPLESIRFWLKPFMQIEYYSVEHFSIIDTELALGLDQKYGRLKIDKVDPDTGKLVPEKE